MRSKNNNDLSIVYGSEIFPKYFMRSFPLAAIPQAHSRYCNYSKIFLVFRPNCMGRKGNRCVCV